jgi:hypothetical protein
MVAPVLSQSKLLTLDKCDATAANQVFGYLPTNTSSIVGTVSHACIHRNNTGSVPDAGTCTPPLTNVRPKHA